MKGRIFVIAGPSGVGKDTIMEILIKKLPNLVKAISYTDRLKRADDKLHTYRFISKEEFDEYLKTGEIFEWEYARDNINRYGSSKKEFDMLNVDYVYLVKYGDYIEKLPFSPGDLGVAKLYDYSYAEIWKKVK